MDKEDKVIIGGWEYVPKEKLEEEKRLRKKCEDGLAGWSPPAEEVIGNALDQLEEAWEENDSLKQEIKEKDEKLEKQKEVLSKQISEEIDKQEELVGEIYENQEEKVEKIINETIMMWNNYEHSYSTSQAVRKAIRKVLTKHLTN